MTTLSLCMIVRDESDLLPEFLNATDGLYDELCVLDTGSTDDSVAILEKAGARVHHAAWENDFAKARNQCMAHAQSEWILFLDADEIITPELYRTAREVTLDAKLGAATLAIRNTLENSHYAMSYVVRMFRRAPQIQFAHAIHEDVSDTLLPYLKANNLVITALKGHAEHLGYTRARADKRAKKQRDCDILHHLLEKDPSDLYSWFKLLEQARFWEDSQLLQDTAPQALAALEAAAQDKAEWLKGVHYIGEMLTLLAAGLYPEAHKPALLFLYPDAPREAAAFLTPWEARIAPSAAYYLRRGELREMLGPGATHLQAAAQDYDACLGLRGMTSNTQLATVRPLVGLTRVALSLQEIPEALKFLNLALKHNARDPEALLALAALSQALGGQAGVHGITEAYVQTYGDTPELHGALGEVALRAGDAQQAAAELQIAVGTEALTSPYAPLLDEALMAAL